MQPNGTLHCRQERRVPGELGHWYSCRRVGPRAQDRQSGHSSGPVWAEAAGGQEEARPSVLAPKRRLQAVHLAGARAQCASQSSRCARPHREAAGRGYPQTLSRAAAPASRAQAGGPAPTAQCARRGLQAARARSTAAPSSAGVLQYSALSKMRPEPRPCSSGRLANLQIVTLKRSAGSRAKIHAQKS